MPPRMNADRQGPKGTPNIPEGEKREPDVVVEEPFFPPTNRFIVGPTSQAEAEEFTLDKQDEKHVVPKAFTQVVPASPRRKK